MREPTSSGGSTPGPGVARLLRLPLLLILCAALVSSPEETTSGWFDAWRARLLQQRVVLRVGEVSREGLVIKLAHVELLGPFGALRLHNARVGVSMGHSFSNGFWPRLEGRVARAVMVRRSSLKTHSDAASSQPSSSATTGATAKVDQSLIGRLRATRFWLPVSARIIADRVMIAGSPDVVAVHASIDSGPSGVKLDTRIQGKAFRARAQLGVRPMGRVSLSIEAPKLPMTLARAVLGPERAAMIQSGTSDFIVDAEREEGVWMAKTAVRVGSVCLEHHRFGDGKACGLSLAFSARGALSDEELLIDRASLNLNGVKAWVSGRFPRRNDIPFDAVFNVPPQPVQTVLGAIPKKWRTGLFGFDIAGRFSLKVELAGAGEELTIVPHFRFSGVEVRSAPRGQDPRLLNLPITWHQSFPVSHDAELSRANPHFASLSEIPEVLTEAIRLSEDASFYGHDGFDRDEIGRALTDLKEGKGVRGASTITQQLAKNLFFDGDRNLCRKIEEAIITAALEGSVPKQRLFEVYLNIVEWGEGIYGIGAASQHYFAKKPSELAPDEAAFLAGILPAPRKVDRELKRDGRSAWADKRVMRVVRFMCDLGKVDQATCQRNDGFVRTQLARAEEPGVAPAQGPL